MVMPPFKGFSSAPGCLPVVVGCGFWGQQGEVFHLLSTFIILCQPAMSTTTPQLGQPPQDAEPCSHPANTTQPSVSRQLLIFRSVINAVHQSNEQP